MSQKKLIDAIIICRNESARLMRCIQALDFVDTCIVIDNNSTDDTPNIAKKLGASVITRGGGDFSSLRNIGATISTAKWLLYIDADEIVSHKLKEEILRTITTNDTDIIAYVLPRENYYMGTRWPAYDGMTRLIKKSSFVSWEGELHEHANVTGLTGSMKEYLLHDTHRSLEEMVTKTNTWSAVEAKLRFDSKHPAMKPWRIFRVMVTEFIRSYVRDRGYTVGAIGLIESVYQSFSICITYAKLWEMQEFVISNQQSVGSKQ